MTHNQIEYWKLQEQKRSNAANERENARHNVASEVETNRSNLAKETISAGTLAEDMRHNRAGESETYRHNMANENEATRSNKAREFETWRSNLAREIETQRSNLAKESETNRSNVANEAIKSQSNRITSQHYLKSDAINSDLAELKKWEVILNGSNDIASAFEKAARIGIRLPGIVGLPALKGSGSILPAVINQIMPDYITPNTVGPRGNRYIAG